MTRSSHGKSQDAALVAEASTIVARFRAQDLAQPNVGRLQLLLARAGESDPCALRSEQGDILAAWNVAQPELLPPLPSPAPSPPFEPVLSTSPSPTPPQVESRAPLRTVTLPFRHGTQLYFLQLARPLEPWTRSWIRSLGQFVAPLAIGVLVLWLVARLAASRIARRVLAPLSGLADAVRGLSPGNFRGPLRVGAADAELRGLEEELNAALQRLEEGYRAQAQFAGNVAHELKNPIAALVTDAQVSRLTGHDPEIIRGFMRRAEQELKRLAELVESLLVMARVDTCYARTELVSLDNVARRARRSSSRIAREAGVSLLLELAEPGSAGPPVVRGDAQLLQAMVENLLRNAIHHSPRGAEVRVQTLVSSTAACLIVRDQGPGIAADLREAVFERGVQRASAFRAASGAGLGLAIVNDIVRLHRGSVALQQGEGGGCALVVTLPIEPSPESEAG